MSDHTKADSKYWAKQVADTHYYNSAVVGEISGGAFISPECLKCAKHRASWNTAQLVCTAGKDTTSANSCKDYVRRTIHGLHITD